MCVANVLVIFRQGDSSLVRSDTSPNTARAKDKVKVSDSE